MKCYLIPFALNENNELVPPTNAVKGNCYHCPACKELVVVRKGKVRVHHYSHKPSQICSYNNVIHKTAIIILSEVLKKNIESDGPVIKVERKCLICDATVFQYIPQDYTNVFNEYKIDNGNIVDIAILKSDKIKAFFEIKVTHKIDKCKRLSLEIPFIEIDGNKILANSHELYPLLDYFKPYYCNNCKTIKDSYESELSRYCKLHKIILPNTFYRYALNKCIKCGKNIIVYVWPDKETLLLPKPLTIKPLKLTPYYKNHCIYCGAIQKDADLVDSNNGLFHNFQLSDDFLNDVHLLKLRALKQKNLTTAST